MLSDVIGVAAIKSPKSAGATLNDKNIIQRIVYYYATETIVRIRVAGRSRLLEAGRK